MSNQAAALAAPVAIPVITLTTHGTKRKPTPALMDQLDTILVAQADKLYALDLARKELKDQLAIAEKAYKDAEKKFLAPVNALDLKRADVIRAVGTGVMANVGKEGEKTEVTDAWGVFNILEGLEEGLGVRLMTFSITALKKEMTTRQLGSVTTVTSTGRRRVTFKVKK